MSGRNAMYPMVPGHEIVGRVTSVGKEVSRFKVGDFAGVGVMVDLLPRLQRAARRRMKPTCEKGFVGTYNALGYDGVLVHGGYANNIVCDQRYVLSISASLEPQLAAVAPLLMRRHHDVQPAAPLEGGSLHEGRHRRAFRRTRSATWALKFAHSFGAHTVLFTTSAGKEADGKRPSARTKSSSREDPDAMAKHKASFDFLLDCVSAPHDLNEYLGLLRLNGTLCQVGLPDQPLPVAAFSLSSPTAAASPAP